LKTPAPPKAFSISFKVGLSNFFLSPWIISSGMQGGLDLPSLGAFG